MADPAARPLLASDRRGFLQHTSLAALAFWAGTHAARGATDKLNLGIIGAGGRGGGNLDAVSGENIVAICDIDANMAAGAFQRFPNARRYSDLRRLFDEAGDLNGVVVSTADHTHAQAVCMALDRGLHVYCEKPLVRTLGENATVRRRARDAGKATQMGNQGSAHPGQRATVERVQSGVLGPVREVHWWTNRPIWAQGVPRPTDTPPEPDHIDWDAWCGPQEVVPYSPAYHPFSWRGFWDYGTGALGDMACHIMNMAYRALDLGQPTAVFATNWGDPFPESGPRQSVVAYEFAARPGHPPVRAYWYEGGLKPSPALVEGRGLAEGGTILVGDNGVMLCNNDWATDYVLLPEDRFHDLPPAPETLPRSPGHHEEWLLAAKGQPIVPLSNFAYATDLTETVLLGCLAQQLPEQRIRWNAQAGRSPNTPEADRLINPPRRAGWEL